MPDVHQGYGFTIGGVAINETTTSNGHKFIAEELSKSAHTLIDVPLLKDHENRVDNIVGRVKSAHFDESAKNIPFRAIVKDEKMKQMIKDKLINSVSVGAHVLPQDVEVRGRRRYYTSQYYIQRIKSSSRRC